MKGPAAGVEPVPAESTKDRLKQGPLRAYRMLLEVARRIARGRELPAGATQAVFHCPLEVVALALGVHRVTLWRWLRPLKAQGLLDWRAHKTTCRGQTRNDGTVWAVKLVGDGQPARLGPEDLRRPWRDLEADIREGRTAYKQMQQSEHEQLELGGIELILNWALPPETNSTPLGLNVAPSLPSDASSVLRLPYVRPEQRHRAVEQCSQAICLYLGDSHPRFWCYLLWGLLRLHDSGQDYFETLHLMLRRAGADREEGFARNAGALLVKRLKDSFLWGLARAGRPGRSSPKHTGQRPPTETQAQHHPHRGPAPG